MCRRPGGTADDVNSDDGDNGDDDEDADGGDESTPSELTSSEDEDGVGGGDNGSGYDGDGGRWTPGGAQMGAMQRDTIAHAPAQRVRQSPRLAELEAGGGASAKGPADNHWTKSQDSPKNHNTVHRMTSE